MGRMRFVDVLYPFYTKGWKERRERQLPLGADPSSGEQTFLTEFLLYVHIHPVIISLFFFFFLFLGWFPRPYIL
jgi:hypothetical protein